MTYRTRPRFHYWIHPGTSWGETFCRRFSSPDITMWPDDTHEGHPQDFAFASHHFDDVETPEQLADRSAALKAVFDGAMHLAFGASHHVVPLTDLRGDEHDFHGTRWYFGDVPDVTAEPFSAAYVANTSPMRGSPLDDVVAKLIFLARYDGTAKAILKYVGVQGLTHASLYSCCDWMREAEGWDAKRIATEAGWSNARFGDFTNTANNPAYLGPFARHGGGSARPAPSRPMKLDEAIDPIRKATVAFLSERARNIDLAGRWKAIADPGVEPSGTPTF